MAKKIITFFAILWIAAVTSLCRGWGEEAIQDAMNKAKFGAEEATQDAKEKTGSWADLASNKFSEEFGWDENNVKDGSRRLMSDSETNNVGSEATDEVNSAAADGKQFSFFPLLKNNRDFIKKNFWIKKISCFPLKLQRLDGITFVKACEMADMIHYAEQRGRNGDGNNREPYRFTADRLGGAYDFASKWGYKPTKPYSRRAADEARRNSKDALIDSVFETIHMLEIIAKNERDRVNREEDEAEKKRKVSDSKANIIKMALEGGIPDDKLKLLFGDDGPELLQKLKEAKSNLQETYTFAKETKTQKAKERYEEAKKKASQAARELGRRITGEEF